MSISTNLPHLSTQQKPFFSQTELDTLLSHNLPKHVAIIPDGNRRWAIHHNEPYITAYTKGAQTLITIALAAKEIGIPVLTIYSFSTENWKRSQQEAEMFLQLFDTHLSFYAQSLVESDIRLHFIGNTSALPPFLQKTIEHVTMVTAPGKALDIVFALNYGGRDEIVRAIKKVISTQNQDISEQTISQSLDTAKWPDPDLVIRTSGEQRLSNFLLWQSSYAETYTDPTLWIDFSPHNFLSAIKEYQSRTRRRGGN